MTNPLRICVVGNGRFAQCFIPLFQNHPGVQEVAICDLRPDRVRGYSDRFGIKRFFDSYDEVLKSKTIDAVAIFTPRQSHAPLVLKSLEAEKHVYCAVPAAITLDELHSIVELVQKTGMTYMLGETSYYSAVPMELRRRFRAGDFGRFVYGEGEYIHDIGHMYESFKSSGGAQWKRFAGIPPMLYSTHSVAVVSSVTGERMTKVACFGQVDQESDEIYGTGLNHWDNPFSNQTALFRSSGGGMVRINEFRRIGIASGRQVRTSLLGTAGAYEEQADGSAIVCDRTGRTESLTKLVSCGHVSVESWLAAGRQASTASLEFSPGFASCQLEEAKRLPDSYAGLPNGHEGSHQFLVDDFVTAVLKDRLPPVHVWAAAYYNAPGIVANESARRDGELLEIPDFGWPSH